MRCPVCQDELTVSADRCTFCGYNFDTGRRGLIEAPPVGAAAKARRDGIVLVAVGVPAVLLSALVLVFPIIPLGRLLALFVLLPASGGMVAKGLNGIAQGKRWDLKQRLYDETRLEAAGGPTTPVAGWSSR